MTERVVPSDCHVRRVAVEQFCAPCCIQLKGSKHVGGWIRDHDDKLVVEDIQAVVEDDKQMLVEAEVPHHFETEVKAPVDIEVNPESDIEMLSTSDIEVSPQGIYVDIIFIFVQFVHYM